MPFIASLPTPWEHLQAEDDPVRAAAEAEEGRVASWLESAWNLVVNTVPRIPDRDTPSRISQELLRRAMPIGQGLWDARQGGQNAMALKIGLVRKDFSVSFHFDQRSPAVQEQANLHAARFVREIGEDTRSTVAGMIQDAVAHGLGPPETARTVRESIGLTISQARAVQTYRRMLVEGNPIAATRALHDQRFGANVVDLTPEQIDARVEAYRRRYVAYRATTIARTETLQASNSGAVSVIQSAVKSGDLPKGTVKTWMGAKDERLCPRCLSIVALQPDGVPVDAPFTWRHGKNEGLIQLAPLHPDCRCTNSFRVIGR